MSKAPSEKNLTGKSSAISTDALTAAGRQSRRATIVGPSTSIVNRNTLAPARRILRKNISMSSDDTHSMEHSRTRSGSSGRVHFPENQMTPDHAGEIVVQLSPDQLHADAHLGFLQEGRRYLVNLYVPRYLGDNSTVSKPNAHLKLKEIRTNGDKTGHELVLELETIHDKLVNEEIGIASFSGEFVLGVSARVLGKGKGTPMLKRGVRCIAIEPGDSEMSDASTTPHRSSMDKQTTALRRASASGAAASLKHHH